MTSNNHKLSFFLPLIFLAIFIAAVSALVLFLSSLSQSRKGSVYQSYASETEKYITQNKAQLIALFNQMFPRFDCVMLKRQNPALQSDSCIFPKQEEIARLLPSSLKDWSSTMFIKSEGEKIMIMGLSGDTKELYIYPEQKRFQLQKLLRGETEKIDWDNYSDELTGKEVVIAVKDNNGRIIGAIMRSVIEAQ